MKKWFLSASLVLFWGSLTGIPYITVSLQMPPHEICEQVLQEARLLQASTPLEALLSTPSHKGGTHLLDAHAYEKLNLTTHGFLLFYNGFLDYTNQNGIVEFPLRHDPKEFYVVITPTLIPVFKEPGIIKEWRVPAGDIATSRCFRYTVQGEADNPYWEVSSCHLAENNPIIDAYTIVILTQPSNIVGRSGRFGSSENGQWALPENLYVVGQVQQPATLLSSLDIQRFFEQMRYKTEFPQTTPPDMQQQSIPLTQ